MLGTVQASCTVAKNADIRLAIRQKIANYRVPAAAKANTVTIVKPVNSAAESIEIDTQQVD